jgi:ribosomal protein S18 acetylase RimI-like enzyme
MGYCIWATVAAHFSVNGDAVVGFVPMILDEDPHWGTLLDNLHVTYGRKRHGIGRRLLTEAARTLVQRCPTDRRFYLWVLAQNAGAQAFYAACGGIRVETTIRGPFPGGGRALSHRIAWPDAAVLVSTFSPGG